MARRSLPIFIFSRLLCLNTVQISNTVIIIINQGWWVYAAILTCYGYKKSTHKLKNPPEISENKSWLEKFYRNQTPTLISWLASLALKWNNFIRHSSSFLTYQLLHKCSENLHKNLSPTSFHTPLKCMCALAHVRHSSCWRKPNKKGSQLCEQTRQQQFPVELPMLQGLRAKLTQDKTVSHHVKHTLNNGCRLSISFMKWKPLETFLLMELI